MFYRATLRRAILSVRPSVSHTSETCQICSTSRADFFVLHWFGSPQNNSGFNCFTAFHYVTV